MAEELNEVELDNVMGGSYGIESIDSLLVDRIISRMIKDGRKPTSSDVMNEIKKIVPELSSELCQYIDTEVSRSSRK